ncbi:MAG: hypothetical protein IIB17_00490 [Chloroflexi bacterium]|nr:hypothetical protein [Chloroflexota bacterium]
MFASMMRVHASPQGQASNIRNCGASIRPRFSLTLEALDAGARLILAPALAASPGLRRGVSVAQYGSARPASSSRFRSIDRRRQALL